MTCNNNLMIRLSLKTRRLHTNEVVLNPEAGTITIVSVHSLLLVTTLVDAQTAAT